MFYRHFKLDTTLELSGCGGGRAHDGVCGALYAACRIAPEQAEEIRREFIAAGGSDKCTELKQVYRFPCSECVRLAAEIVEKHKDQNGRMSR